MDLIIEVKEIKGHCPVYKVDDKFKIEAEPDTLGMAGKRDKTKAYVQCLDASSYTDGNTAIFEISRINKGV